MAVIEQVCETLRRPVGTGSRPGTPHQEVAVPPPRPPFVTEIIPAAIVALQRHQQRIAATVAAGGYVDGADDARVLDLCKQILETPQP